MTALQRRAEAAEAECGRLREQLAAHADLVAAAVVVCDEWRAENPFLGYAIEALDRARAALGVEGEQEPA